MRCEKGDGNLPVLSARGESIPEAWENSVLELYKKGLWWSREGPKDKGNRQLDSTMTIIITPSSDLYMHKFLTCDIESLYEYQLEILGAKDSWVSHDPNSTKWEYHYHERLANYPAREGYVNQIERLVEGLAEEPWKRRYNMITWSPETDFDLKDPPCLQRIWCALIPDESSSDESSFLNMNYNFRSRNVMIAAHMNMVGLRTLQDYIIRRVVEKTGRKIKPGRIVDIADSYHVSSSNVPLLEKFLTLMDESQKRGESSADRCIDKQRAFSIMDREAVVNRIITQTEKELAEKGESYRFEEEVKKIWNIYEEVSQIEKC